MEEHAQTLLEHAKDIYGPQKTPLFVDALNTQTYEPYIWEDDSLEPVIARFGQPTKQIMANFLFMQNVLVTLKELSALTGNPEYKNSAEQCANYALNHTVDEHGLIHWGKHSMYNALADSNLGHHGKPQFIYFNTGGYPDWSFLYSVNPQAVNKHIERQWNVIFSKKEWWRRLEFNLHPYYGYPPYKKPWTNVALIEEYVEIPFVTKSNVMYPQVSFDLIYSALVYSSQEGNDQRAYKAAKILLDHFRDARDPNTKLPMSSYGIPG